MRWGFRTAFLGEGIFTMDGPFWAHSRAILRPQFEKHQVSDLRHFEPHVQRLFANIPTGSAVDMQALFNRLSMDTSSEFLTGTSTLLLDKEYNTEGHKFNDAFEHAMADGTQRNRLGWLYWLSARSEGMKASETLRRYADAWVDKAMDLKRSGEKQERKKGEYIFLNQLALDDRMDAERIRSEILSIMLAGRDTTAALLSDLFFVLAREPRVMENLRAEIHEQLHGDLPTYDQLRNMKYLKYCVQEGESWQWLSMFADNCSATPLSSSANAHEDCREGYSPAQRRRSRWTTPTFCRERDHHLLQPSFHDAIGGSLW